MTMFPKPNRIRLKGAAKTALRRRVFERDGWRCKQCDRPCSWASGHLAHIVSVGAGGSDTEENTELLCADCHLVGCHNPKSVPRKCMVPYINTGEETREWLLPTEQKMPL